MAIDYAAIAAAGGIPKSKPGVLSRHERRVSKDAALKKAYDAVDARDGKRCQVRGTRLFVGHVNEWKALERDHLGPRSTHPEDRAEPDNILTVSRGVHALLQAGALVPVDKKGRETIRVSKIAGYRWNRNLIEAGKEPFRLAEKNLRDRFAMSSDECPKRTSKNVR